MSTTHLHCLTAFNIPKLVSVSFRGGCEQLYCMIKQGHLKVEGWQPWDPPMGSGHPSTAATEGCQRCDFLFFACFHCKIPTPSTVFSTQWTLNNFLCEKNEGMKKEGKKGK